MRRVVALGRFSAISSLTIASASSLTRRVLAERSWFMTELVLKGRCTTGD